jgi:hypothetical protein
MSPARGKLPGSFTAGPAATSGLEVEHATVHEPQRRVRNPSSNFRKRKAAARGRLRIRWRGWARERVGGAKHTCSEFRAKAPRPFGAEQAFRTA